MTPAEQTPLTEAEWLAVNAPAQATSTTPQTEAEWLKANAPATAEIEVTSDNPGVTDYLKDMAFGVSAGANKAVNEVMDLSWGVGNFAKEAWDKGITNAEFREPTKEEQANMWRLPVVQEAETLPGKLVQGITQFATGFATTGTAMKAAKVLQGAGGMTQLAKPMVQGAIADFAAFDAHEERLSNLVEEYPALSGPITSYLAADDNNSMMEGRFKNALEGLGLGVLTDGLLQGLKALKGIRKAKNADEAIAALDNAKPTASPDLQPVKSENTPQTGDKAPHSSPVEAPKQNGPTITPESPSKAPETAPYKEAVLSADEMKSIVDKAANADEALVEIHSNINLKRMIFETPQGSHVLQDMADALADKTLKVAGKESHVKVFADTKAELEEFGMDYTEAVAEVGSNPKALNALTRRMLANRNILHMMTTEMSRLSAKISMGTNSIVDQAQFAMLTKNIQEMHLQTADMRTEVGRALSAMKMEVNDDTARTMLGDDFLKKWLTPESMTNEDAAAWLAREGWMPDDLKQLAKDIELTGGYAPAVANLGKNAKPGVSVWGILNEIRINGLLSGPKTLAINGLSSAIKTVTMPAETMIGAAMTGDTRTMAKAAKTYVGMYKFFGEAWSMAGKAMKTGTNVLDTRSGIMEVPSYQVSYESVKNSLLRNRPTGAALNEFEELLAHGVGWLGTTIRLPSRVLLTTDEFFKQLNFRADMYSKLYMEATEKGMKNSDQIADYVETTMRQAFDENGAVVRGELTADSLLTAQRSTWTQDLDDGWMGKTGKWIQGGANSLPLVRFIFPFVKTPTNIIRDFVAHVPGLAGLTKEYKTAIKAGGEEAARVRGQVAVGALTVMTGYMLAANGFITGSPPKNPKLRKAWEATGWEPYSFKIGDSYISLRRADPIGMFFGACADVVAIATQKDDLSELTQQQILGGLFGMVFNNITSKTYMQGLTEAINVMTEGERYGTSFTGRALTTFVPYSSALREYRKDKDPYMREMESVLDYTINTVPGMSESLPAKHNWVTGQMVDYRPWLGHDNNNPVLDELARLGTSVVGAPPKKLEGVELTADQYSKLNELHGTVKIGGKNMQQALERLFNSPGYDLERSARPDAPEGMPNPRADKANKIIDRYRKAAVRELKRSDDELQSAVLEAEVRRKASKRGILNKTNEQEVLDKFLNR